LLNLTFDIFILFLFHFFTSYSVRFFREGHIFLTFTELSDLKLKCLRIQRQIFCSVGRELTKAEYKKLLDISQTLGKERLSLLMQTICATGILVSGVKYITVEAVKAGKAEISLKGKIRTILLTGKLCKKLLKYAKVKNKLQRDISHQKRQ